MLIAMLTFGLMVTAASASRGIQTNSAGLVSAESTNYEMIAGETTINCTITRALSLHRTISKVTGSLAGFVSTTQGETEREQPNCTESGGGRPRFRALRLPWHIQYQTFTGELPRIRELRLRIVGMSWLIEYFRGLMSCLFEGNAIVDAPVVLGETIRALKYNISEIALSISLSIVTCPSTMSIRGELTLARNLTVTLI
jgi:hypothetical protein